MGKKKNASGMGKALIRDRFKGKSQTISDSERHTAELADGYDWNRINLQSVTEQSHLDEFLSIAELANTDFEAERLNITVVNSHTPNVLPSKDEEHQILQTQAEHKRFLQIPRRPSWNTDTTPEELDEREKQAFLEWRRGLARLQEVEGLLITPAERNLYFWRQLWRVVERSDIVVQIVDARNPLLYCCDDLDSYVQDVAKFQGVTKVNVVLINKADYLSSKQRKYWAEYFDKVGKRVAFWSAIEEAKRYEELRKHLEDVEGEESDEDTDDLEGEDSDEDTDDLASDSEAPEEDRQDFVKYEATDGNDEWESCSSEEETDTKLSEKDGEKVSRTASREQDQATAQSQGGSTGDTSLLPSVDGEEGSCEVKNSWLLMSSEGLVALLKSLHTGKKKGDVLTVGMTGYPNVGKSSTINTLLHAKKVAVSVTPGKTKHFQTMYLDSELLLCDCPGLVMPTFVCTKADMVVCGILPVDQMREYEAPVALVCKQMSREVLEANYGIMLPKPNEEDGEDPQRPPTPHELLAAHGYVRGFMTHKGIPDFQKSARAILKDYVKGRLLYCHPPPEVSVEAYHPVGPALKPLKQHKEELRPASKQSKIDKDFFQQRHSQAWTKGGQRVMAGVSDRSSASGSTQTISEKPWKKHFKHNKKEKLRRQFKDLDV